jgi:hypothetical protein
MNYLAFILHILVSYLKPNFKKDYKHTYEDGSYEWVMDRQTNNVSAKIQCYFILKTTGSKYLIKLFDIKKLCNIYFDDADHPIRSKLNDE